MKAFLLAAGHGTRLRPLTDTTPKCLLPIRGVPILQIWLDTCRIFGIREVLINLHAHANAVQAFIQKQQGSLRVTLVEEQELQGSAGTIRNNRGWVSSDEYFWVFYADVLAQVDLAAMLKLHQKRQPVATIGAHQVLDPTRCGILDVLPDGTVVDFVEKPKHPRGNLAFSGLMVCSQGLFDAIPPNLPVDLGSDVLPSLAGRMVGFPINTYLLDIGTKENYEAAQKSWPGLYDKSTPND